MTYRAVDSRFDPSFGQDLNFVNQLNEAGIVYYNTTDILFQPHYHYVSATATGNANGGSWANAYTSLAQALDSALAGDTVLVAAGTYTPADAATGFVLPNGVTVLGGWAGDETTFDQAALDARNLAANASVLSGNLGGSNAEHVVSIGETATASTVLDGFTIQEGHAVATGRGGGVYNGGGAPLLRNLIIQDNQAASQGGGLYVRHGSHPVLENVQLRNNSAVYGGALHLYNAQLTANGLLATGNTATWGGALSNDRGALSLANASLSGNTATRAASLFAKNGATSTLTNLIIWNDASVNDGGRPIYNYPGVSTTFSHCLVQGSIQGSGSATTWNTAFGTNGGNNLNADPLFTNTTAFTLATASPALGAGNPAQGPNIGWYQGSGERLFTAGIYVYAGASGENNGSSWANAFTSLQDALERAVAGDTIWVAQGTYLPTTGSDRAIRFMVHDSVSLFGGFAGNEASITQAVLDARDFGANTSVLSGDIGVPGDSTDNSTHVVQIHNAQGVLLDGFTITEGHANIENNPYASGWDKRGGGLAIYNSSAQVANVTITRCYAKDYGAAIIVTNTSQLWLANGLITQNHAGVSGGGIHNGGGLVTLANTTLTQNLTDGYRGVIYNDKGTTTLANVLIWNNLVYGSPALYNIYNNAAVATTISHSLIQGSGGSAAWRTAFGTNGGNNLDADPLLAADGYSLLPGSPAVGAGNGTNGTNIGYDQSSTNARLASAVGRQAPTAQAVAVYPNPTRNEVHVKAEGFLQVQLTDALGRQVAKASGQNLVTLSLASQPAGIYLLVIQDAQGRQHHQRVVKQ